MSDIETRIRKLLVDHFGDQHLSTAADADLSGDLDSLEIVELQMAVEEEFGIDDIPTEQGERMKSIRDFATHVLQQTGGGLAG